ncbi:DUF502 domain-containing protein [Halobaculum sp. P14]|uniref:DUF502 domain-containing protein n=1 Tax=Halobaculum sp. P14 TaxID=3421638 RepID=UPI003EB76A31
MDVIGRIRSSFLAGLLLVAPLAVTLFILDFTVDRLTALLAPVVRGSGLAELVGSEPAAQVLAVALLAVGLTAVGFVASHEAGRRLFGGVERGVKLLPVVRAVYFGVRQVSESLASPEAGYDRVALVEYPQPGRYRIGFVTGRAPRYARDATDEELYSVFFPNSPNPTGGALALVRDDDVRELDVSVRRGLRLLITTGLSGDDAAAALPDQPSGDDDAAHARTGSE